MRARLARQGARRRALTALASALTLAVCGCSPAPELPPGPTFILLSIDTLRADRLGCYGYPEGTSPALDRLARRAVQFRECVSVSSWTMPAMGTLATGLRPNEHGMVYWHLPLANVPETVGEVLAAEGIATAFFGNPIPSLDGLERGYDAWNEYDGDDGAATDAAIRWLETTGGRRFLWVHLLAPHAPYDPKPFTVRSREGVDERELKYDAEIRTVDLDVQRLLRAAGPEAAIFVTADHGESLLERRELQFDHGKFLYDELILVPGIFRSGGEAAEAGARVESETIQIADVPATACEWFGVAPPIGSYGISLRDWAAARPTPADERLHARTFSFVVEDEPPQRKERRWAVRSPEGKAVLEVDRERWKWYELAQDPGERRNRAKANPERVAGSTAELDAWLQAWPTPPIPFDQQFSPEELGRLQSLGYLGGADGR